MARRGVGKWCILMAVMLFVAFTVYVALRRNLHKNYSTIRKAAPHSDESKGRLGSVLVTGGAGFIGFHTALRLKKDRLADEVVVLDNFNDYYSVQLKKDRAKYLLQYKLVVHNADLCDDQFLRHLFAKHKFTAVVHMAAQAGISHSLVDPVSYVQNNIECMTTLLDVLTTYKNTLLVYASSSSVYGQSSPVPFSLNSPPSPPANLYAALKLAGEYLVTAYCKEYQVKAVGLRFFTVYGPWGRPDMAVYKFAKKILSGEKIIFHENSHTVQRDFTYIDDVVDCVLVALRYTPVSCSEVYNVGRGKPVSLTILLQLLETHLGRTANLEMKPLPSSELPLTQADLSETEAVFGYQPKVDLEQGVELFVDWLKEYYEHKQFQDNDELESALKESHSQQTSVHDKHIHYVNQAYMDNISRMSQRYFMKTKTSSPHIEKTKFTYYPGRDSPGGTIMKAVGFPNPKQIHLLKAKCLSTEQCLAFNSFGEIKARLKPMASWINVSHNTGLYVADVDICAADLHDCVADASCHKTGPSQYICVCKKGFIQIGKKCIELYSENKKSTAEANEILADAIDGVDWDQITSGAQFVFIQGFDSPDGDYLLVADAVGDIPKLITACKNTHRCIAFNTNGILKLSVLPPQRWVHWSTQSQHGLYVLDIDYCSLALEECPRYSSCVRHGPGNYSCSCTPPRVWSSEDERCVLPFSPPTPSMIHPHSVIHVVVSVDTEHYPGLVALVHSTIKHCSRPDLLHFHVVVTEDHVKRIEQMLDCYKLRETAQIEVIHYHHTDIQDIIHVTANVDTYGNLASPANFARFFFHEIFHTLTHILYFDADTVVKADISLLWEQLVTSNKLLLAAPRSQPSYGQMFNLEVDALFYQKNGFHFDPDSPTFNAGVYGVHLEQWRQRGLHSTVVYWMEQHAKNSLWKLGTQPILLLVVYDQWEAMDKSWNVDGLGWRKNLSPESLSHAFILHWSGKWKPWLSNGFYKDTWLQEYPEACSGQGKCVQHGEEFVCDCNEPYTGHQCQYQ